MTRSVRVVLTGARPIVRQGLAGVLAEEGLDVVEATNPGEPRPAVVVVDVAGQPPGRAGQLLELAVRAYPDAGVVVLAERGETVPDAGAADRLPIVRRSPDITPEELAATVREVGGAPPGARRGPPPGLERLSPREREVVELVLAGHDDRRVAAALGVGTGTVRTHLRRAAAKLELAEPLRPSSGSPAAGRGAYLPPAARPFSVRIALESHERLAGSAVAHLLAQQPPFRVVADGAEPVDVVVVVGVVADVAAACERRPGVPVLHVASAADAGDPYESLRSGARAQVGPADGPAELVAGVERLAVGGAHLSAAGLRTLVDQLRSAVEDDDLAVRRLVDLTRAERSVLALVVDGRSVDQIADHLVVSPLTARTHLQGILRKLGAHSRAEAVAYARRHRLVERLAPGGGPAPRC